MEEIFYDINMKMLETSYKLRLGQLLKISLNVFLKKLNDSNRKWSQKNYKGMLTLDRTSMQLLL